MDGYETWAHEQRNTSWNSFKQRGLTEPEGANQCEERTRLQFPADQEATETFHKGQGISERREVRENRGRKVVAPRLCFTTLFRTMSGKRGSNAGPNRAEHPRPTVSGTGLPPARGASAGRQSATMLRNWIRLLSGKRGSNSCLREALRQAKRDHASKL